MLYNLPAYRCKRLQVVIDPLLKMPQSKLFSPIQVGSLDLSHRIVLAPLTRLRANAEHVPGELAIEYYTQRASVPGTLLISEGTLIAAQATGLPHVPGIWNDAQISAWKKVRTPMQARILVFS